MKKPNKAQQIMLLCIVSSIVFIIAGVLYPIQTGLAVVLFVLVLLVCALVGEYNRLGKDNDTGNTSNTLK